MRLDGGDVGADRDVAAVLGAPFADVEPAPVVELRLESARARRRGAVGGSGGAHDRLASGRDDGLVRGAGADHLVGKVVQSLEIGVAQDQAVVGVPQHEGFRDRLDGVAQAQVGRDGLLHQVLLLAGVDRDADEMRIGAVALADDLAARTQPYPVAARVPHAERTVDRPGLAVGKVDRQLVEPDILRVNQRADLAEGQEVVARLKSQDREHRMGPEDAPAREVPVPQSAAPAIERGIDAAPHGVVDRVRLARARRLPVEREAQDQHHEAGGCREGHGEGGVGAPRRERDLARLDHRDLAERRLQAEHRRERLGAVGERRLHHARARREGGERLRRPEDVEQGTADVVARRRRRHDGAVEVADQDRTSALDRMIGQRAVEQLLRAPDRVVLGDDDRLIEPQVDDVRGRGEAVRDRADRLASMIADLHDGADRHGGEEGDDENRNGASQRGLGDEEASIRGLGDRLSQALDRIRTR